MATETDIGYVATSKRKAPATDEKYHGWPLALIWSAFLIFGASAIYFIVTAALSLGSGS